ncbi:MAG: PIG-L family deacetylase [Candidatus Omnitrophota bacterium]
MAYRCPYNKDVAKISSLIIPGIILFLSCAVTALASDDITFRRSDRVLVLAPHPDDEAIAAFGVMKKALGAGAKVKVVCLTNGDNNEIAFLIYKKHPVLSAKGLIAMGETRMKETLAAMSGMGLGAQDVSFLGYPDFGTLAIFTGYWGDGKPYEAMLTKQTKVPYAGAVSCGAPYTGESILKDLEDILTQFRPTDIFVSHPSDSNPDHKALYLFLRVALWDTEGSIEPPSVYPYIVHVQGWPAPKGYHPEMDLKPPVPFKRVSWGTFDLPQEDVKAKHDAIRAYKSQLAYDPSYLFSFARRNELFGDYAPLKMKDGGRSGIYGIEDGSVIVHLATAGRADVDRDFTAYLIGYKKGRGFSGMPKLHIRMDADGLHCRDRHIRLSSKEVSADHGPRMITLRVPLSLLEYPDRIFACVEGRTEEMQDDDTHWRILELKP